MVKAIPIAIVDVRSFIAILPLAAVSGLGPNCNSPNLPVLNATS
jgi:hypothetical protein